MWGIAFLSILLQCNLFAQNDLTPKGKSLKNLGIAINSEFDEFQPIIINDTLYFKRANGSKKTEVFSSQVSEKFQVISPVQLINSLNSNISKKRNSSSNNTQTLNIDPSSIVFINYLNNGNSI